MCFGPSKAEKEAAAEQRLAADQAKQEEARKRAVQKREDISQAISSRAQRKYGRSGKGRRSLMQSATGGGFLGRFQ